MRPGHLLAAVELAVARTDATNAIGLDCRERPALGLFDGEVSLATRSPAGDRISADDIPALSAISPDSQAIVQR